MLEISIKNLSPGQYLILGYIIVILAGTILLLLPIATVDGQITGITDALFTATSATAVTGLIVVNTAEHWTRFGQLIIMILIQIGGFGFMTSTTMISFIFGHKVSLRKRLIIMEDLNYKKISGAIRLTKYIIILTFIVEFIGALLLYIYFQRVQPASKAIFFSIFHSISAFNNAGFDLFGNSLENFVLSPYVNFVIALLFIIGGLGFIVINEIYSKLSLKNLSIHSKMVLSITLILIIIGFLAVLILEYNNPATLGRYKLPGKLMAAFFQGVTSRTAGFNTINIGSLREVTLFTIVILMFIGASPGSTGGGVKTTTVGTLMLVVYNMALGKEDIEIFERRLKKKDIYKALTVIVISLLLINLVTIILSLTEDFTFIEILFEVFSAFGTVGLSTGITADLSIIGRLFIIVTMFVGRVGPFTVAVALGKRLHSSIRYPEEDIIIG